MWRESYSMKLDNLKHNEDLNGLLAFIKLVRLVDGMLIDVCEI